MDEIPFGFLIGYGMAGIAALAMIERFLPVLLDSPGYSPRVAGNTIEVRVPFADLAVLRGARFDGFTAELRLGSPGAVPLLCVAPPVDSASGNLSLPGLVR